MQLIQLNTQSVSMDVLNSDSAINTKNCKIHAEFVHRKYQKVVNGAVVSHWTCVNFSRGVQESAAQEFCQELASMCQVSGLVILFFAVLVDVMFLASDFTLHIYIYISLSHIYTLERIKNKEIKFLFGMFFSHSDLQSATCDSNMQCTSGPS